MKSIFLGFIMISTTSLFAQKFEIGLNGGFGFNTAPTIDFPRTWQNYRDIQASDLSTVFTLEVLQTRKKWQYGIATGVLKLSCKYYYFGYPNPYPLPFVNAAIANPGIPVKAVLNRQLSFHKLHTYAGVSAGYVFAKTKNMYLYDNNAVVTGGGWMAGVQAGATYKLTKRLGINSELQASYMRLDIGGARYTLWYIPFTVGIRYDL